MGLEPRQGAFLRGIRLAFIIAVALRLLGPKPARGCGPFFPNWLLSGGDDAVLVAPIGNFPAELERLTLARPRFQSIPPDARDYSGQSIEAEMTDLRSSLKQQKTLPAEVERVCREHQCQRQRLAEFIKAARTWKDCHSEDMDGAAPFTNDAPTLPNVELVEGLPLEFANYLEGLIRWHDPALVDKQPARELWQKLLARGESERRFKSTWAAFMLGKSWEKADPQRAIGYFKQVRELAANGYRDTLGLAAASIGFEARVSLTQTNCQRAIELYLEQMAGGEPTATNSLAEAAAMALELGANELRSLAQNEKARKVLTAYVISRQRDDVVYRGENNKAEAKGTVADRWLDAVEAAGVKDIDSAEGLALVAYRANQIDKARRWIARAPNSPVAQWLRAKLLLRAGRLAQAAALLAEISPRFPIIHEGTNAPPATERKDILTVGNTLESFSPLLAERQVQGELGVLKLSRGEFIQALDCLLRAGFWMDAAYVAERVLTCRELQTYVDRFWPAVPPEQVIEEQERFGPSQVNPALLREHIRYLLARRLARDRHEDHARPYYPSSWLGAFDRLNICLQAGLSENVPTAQRAAALFEAAMLTRTNGMELIGTEVAPDWHIHDGQFGYGVTGEERATNQASQVLRPGAEELQRNSQHRPDPDTRFHYRYQAASLAWESARLLPDNTDETAYILWQGGCFLKTLNAQVADYFYKALVLRNRKTALGMEADRQRWFPKMDENGNILPPKRSTIVTLAEPVVLEPGVDLTGLQAPEVELNAMPETASGPVKARKGYRYIIQKGDTWRSVIQACEEAGLALTADELLEANPGVEPARLKVGQVLFVPDGVK